MNLKEEEDEDFVFGQQSHNNFELQSDKPKDLGLQAGNVGGGSRISMDTQVFKLDEKFLIDARSLFVGSKIGEGAHGKVYQGRYRDQAVAVKIIQRGEALEERATLEARFVREVAMMSKVQHKNLVKFIGACKDPEMVIATELLPAMTLRKYMLNLRPKLLELHVAMGFALDIAQAMDCLHANGIIHRDLKPDNLLLTANQKSVKLVDFGLAREESLTEMMTAETGTYRWMAPELYSTVTLRQGDKKHYSNKVDVYSFSIVLWELLTNRMPFEGMSNLQAAYAAAFKQVRPSIPDDLPNDLVFILQSCWAEDPNIRPNFTQIVRMLNTFLFTLPGCPQSSVLTSKSSNSSKESVDARLARSNALEDGSVATVSRAKRRFSFLRRYFASGKNKNLT